MGEACFGGGPLGTTTRGSRDDVRLSTLNCPQWVDQGEGVLSKRGRSDVGERFATRTTVSGCNTKENGNYQTAGNRDGRWDQLRRDVLESLDRGLGEGDFDVSAATGDQGVLVQG